MTFIASADAARIVREAADRSRLQISDGGDPTENLVHSSIADVLDLIAAGFDDLGGGGQQKRRAPRSAALEDWF